MKKLPSRYKVHFTLRLEIMGEDVEKGIYHFDVSQSTAVDSQHLGAVTDGIKGMLIRATNAMELIGKGGYERE
ncbi:MAG: hypothetical protein ACI3VJ_05180 [Hominicoprocola sp.]